MVTQTAKSRLNRKLYPDTRLGKHKGLVTVIARHISCRGESRGW